MQLDVRAENEMSHRRWEEKLAGSVLTIHMHAQVTHKDDVPLDFPSLLSLVDRDADSQRIQFEFAEFAANSVAARIRCKFGVKFRVLRIRGEFGLRIRRRQAPAAARALL